MKREIKPSGLPIEDLESVVEQLIESGRQVKVLWQYPARSRLLPRAVTIAVNFI